MPATKLAPLSGIAFPTPRVVRMSEVLHGKGFAASIGEIVEDAIVVDALAGALDRAFSAGLSSDGRLDLREAAMHLIKELKANQL